MPSYLAEGRPHPVFSGSVYASLPHCLGVLVSVPCATWSVANLAPPRRTPPRTEAHKHGTPGLPANIAARVSTANRILINAITIVEAAVRHGASFLFESPVPYGRGSAHAIPGREEHVSMWDMPELIAFAARHGCQHVDFDRCRTGDCTRKATRLLCSRSIYAA